MEGLIIKGKEAKEKKDRGGERMWREKEKRGEKKR